MDNITIRPNHIEKMKSKTLDERLAIIELDKNTDESIRNANAWKVIKDKVLGSFKPFELILVLLDWRKEKESEVKKIKEGLLLEEYFNKTDSIDDNINKVKIMIENPYGFSLLNKILQILDDNPIDEELTKLLSSALIYIINKESFEDLFSQHKYILSQIASLTPYELLILSDHKNYPPFYPKQDFNDGSGRLISPWIDCFSEAYIKKNNIIDDIKSTRIKGTILGLAQKGYLEGYYTDECDICKIADHVKELLNYVSA